MRDILRNLNESDYWGYGITEQDFDHVVTLVREMIAAVPNNSRVMPEKFVPSSQIVQTTFLTTPHTIGTSTINICGNLRCGGLQGLIEAVITHQLLESENSKKLFGLKAKLEALQEPGTPFQR